MITFLQPWWSLGQTERKAARGPKRGQRGIRGHGFRAPFQEEHEGLTPRQA